MRRWTIRAGFVGIAWAQAVAWAAESPLNLVRSGLEQWVQTRQLISRTRTDWEAEKESLAQSKALFARELAGIAEQRSRISTNNGQVEHERAGAEKELAENRDALEGLRTVTMELEGRVRALVPGLPGPLQDTLRPLLAKLPEAARSAKAAVPERLQTVVSLLNEIDKFNGAVTIASEKRRNAGGEEVAVEVVYVGLGAAYFVNQGGDFAGVGKPGAAGWEWVAEPGLAGAVREVVGIYRGERTATFVSLPMVIR